MKKLFTLGLILLSFCSNVKEALGQACAGTPATATITTAPIVTPLCGGSTQTINANSNVVSTGNFFQWQQSSSGSGPWSNVTGASSVSYTTPPLYITTFYRLADSCGNSHLVSYSAAFQVPVNAFNISVQPSNASVCAGSNTSFSVTAAGTTLQYQWYVNTGSGFVIVSPSIVYSGTTAATLVITGATAAMNGYTYECAVSDACNPATYTSVATLSVSAIPTITTPPSAVTACVGTNTNFTIVASGSNLTYQWQLNTGSGYAPVSNGGIYSGATTASLSITGVTNTMNGYSYRCVVTSSPCAGVLSTGATLTINTLPTITAQPLNDTVCSATNAFFAVAASGTGTSVQWQVNTGSGFVNVTNGTLYSGATSNTLNITNVTTAMNGYLYHAVITGTCSPAATSNNAVLSVTQSPTIAIQPLNDTVCVGSPASYSVIAQGGGLSYQWQVNTGSGYSNVVNGGVYSNATTSTLNISATSIAMNNYSYRCVVTSSSCTAVLNSNGAVLYLYTLPAVSANPSPIAACAGSNTSFSVSGTGTGLTYQWKVNQGAGFVNVSGATSSLLTLTAVTTGMNGYTYECVISGFCLPPVTSTAAALTVTAAPVFTTQPIATSVCAGSNTSFTVAVAPVSGVTFTYIWQRNGVPLTNNPPYTNVTTATLNITGATVGLSGGSYSCLVSANGCTGTSSNAAILTVNAIVAPSVTIAANPGTTICAGTSVTFTATPVNGGATPSYQWKLNGVNVGTNSNTYTNAALANLSLVTCTLTSNAACVSTPTANSNTLIMTVNALPPATASAGGLTTFCAGGSVTLTANSGAGISYAWLTGGVPNGTTTQTYVANATGSYAVKVTNTTTGCNSTSSAISVTVNPLPNVTITAGGPTTFCQGGSVALSVPSGSNQSYTWKLGTQLIAGAITNTNTATVSGSFTAIVTNTLTGCTATSSPALVVVNALPVVTLTLSNTTTFCLADSITMSVPLVAGNTYQWYNLAGAITGASSNSYKTYTSGSFYVKVNNASGCLATSATTVVTVNSLPAASMTAGGPISFCNGGTVLFSALPTGAGITYTWMRNGSVISGATTSTYTASTAGSYYVKVNNGCVAMSDTIPVNINALPATPLITSAGSTSFCDGGSVYLSVPSVAGISLQWEMNGSPITGATSAGFTATTAGSYSVMAIDDSGCVANSFSTLVNVNAPPVAPTISDTAASAVICWGNTLSLFTDAVSGFTYQWYDNNNKIIGAVSPNYNAPDSGNYTLVITDGNGCTSMSNSIYVTAVILNPVVTPAGADLCAGGGTFSAYQWFYNGSAISGANNACYTPTQEGAYWVVVTNDNCTATTSPYYVFNLSIANLGFNKDDIKVYPNPASSVMHISAPVKVNVSISGIEGKVFIHSDAAKDIDISQLPDGMYMVMIYDENNTLIKIEKLLKSN